MSRQPMHVRMSALVVGVIVLAAAVASASDPCLEMSLQEAAAKGLVTLTAKGGYSGDVVAIDAIHSLATDKCIHIKARVGDTILPKDPTQQILVVVKPLDVVLGPGQSISLGGLWAMCAQAENSVPSGVLDVGPNLDSIPGEAAAQLLALAEHLAQQFEQYLDQEELLEVEPELLELAQSAVWAITDQYEAVGGSAEMLEIAGIFELVDDFPEIWVNPNAGQIVSGFVPIPLPPQCPFCTPCTFASVPGGPIGPVFTHCGLTFIGTVFPLVPTDLRITDSCPADAKNELQIGSGPLTIFFPTPVQCIEITYCHTKDSPRLTALNAANGIVDLKVTNTMQRQTALVVLAGTGITRVLIEGEEVNVLKLCYY